MRLTHPQPNPKKNLMILFILSVFFGYFDVSSQYPFFSDIIVQNKRYYDTIALSLTLKKMS